MEPIVTSMQLTQRPYSLGLSLEDSGMDQSSAGDADLLVKLPEVAEIASVFFHVQWNKLRHKPLLAGHERNVRVSDVARARGLELLLVFDFTHDGQDRSRRDLGVGRLNKFPDREELPAGGLDNPAIRDAYQEELLAVVGRIRPAHVRIGVEINIFYHEHPEMWPAYVTMYNDCYEAVKAAYPEIDVSAYTARPPGEAMIAALKQLVPRLDSLGYSFYYDAPWELPAEHWTGILRVDRSKPLFIPEFGVRSTGGKVQMPDFGIDRPVSDIEVTLDTQRQALAFVLERFATLDTSALVWFSLYDQDYSGNPEWFNSSFTTIGLLDRNGNDKPSMDLWRDTMALPRKPLHKERR